VSKEKYFEGIGRRKVASARVRIYAGDKSSTINDQAVDEYFAGIKGVEKDINQPFIVSGLEGKYYFTAKVQGGGITGQIDAIKLGISRALYKMDESLKPALRKEGLVTRDPRAVERKKYHHVKARKKPQFSKR
jgi:small subunit ribosomal protein S9